MLAQIRNSIPKILIVVMAFSLVPFLQAQNETSTLQGHWEGTINISGTSLDIDIDFSVSNGIWAGDISIPAQGAKDLPLSEIVIAGNTTTFKLPNMPGDPAFRGTFSEDHQAISGDFNQAGQTFVFRLERMDAPVIRIRKALEGFDSFVAQAIQDWKVPGLTMAVVVGDQVAFSANVGYRDVENKLPVTSKTLFAIGSSTKAFTTFVMATFVDKGMLAWDKPVREFMPEFALSDLNITDRITPRDLVTHRSGLPRHDLLWYNNHESSRAEIVHRLRFLPLSEDLRAKFQYNNLMYLTAGYLVEQLSGKTWEETVRERIFEPLGMTSSNFSVDESQSTEDFALPYREENDKIERMAFRQIDLVGPAGSINSNLEDMIQWITLHLNQGKQIVNPSILTDLHSPHMTTGATVERPEISQASYGLGWFIDTYRGHQRVHHGGAIDGFIAMVMLFPNDDMGMVILTNKNLTRLPQILTQHAADRIFNLEKIDWNDEALERRRRGAEAQEEAERKIETRRKKGTKPSHKLVDYAGEYAHPGYGILTVELTNNRLAFSFNGISTPLEHWHYDVFNGLNNPKDDTFEYTKLLFRTDVNGNVASVEVAMEPCVDPIIFRKKPDARLSNPDYLKKFTGEYELQGQTLHIDLVGNILKLTIPGQPQYTLVPDLGDAFVLKESSLINITFTQDANGRVTALELSQPSGVYTAEYKD